MDRGSEGEQRVQVEAGELGEVLFDCYREMRENGSGVVTDGVVGELARVQREVLAVVELRKDMEYVLEKDALQHQHFTTVAGLVEKQMGLEQRVDQMAQQMHRNDSTALNETVQMLIRERKERCQDETSVIRQVEQAMMEISSLRREIVLPEVPLYSAIERTENEPSAGLDDMFRAQAEKWSLLKRIYSTKLKQVALREELVEERQKADSSHHTSQNQVLESLLRDRERDKNLRRREKEKFEEILKARHALQMENQELNHSERGLVSALQLELMKLKHKIQDMEQVHEKEVEKWKKLVNELESANQSLVEQQQKSEQKISSLELSNAEVVKNLQEELQAIRTQLQQSEDIKLKVVERNQELQSQMNNAILKSSQLSQLKNQLTHKLDTVSKHNEALKSQLANKDISEARIQQQAIDLQRSLQEQAMTSITLQQQNKDLLHKLKAQSDRIDHLTACVTELQSKQQSLTVQFNDQNAPDQGQLSEFRDQLVQEMKRAENKRSQLIEQLVQSINMIL